MAEQIRCAWAGTEQIYIDYHDKEWGRPKHNDQDLFELLILEGAQAGLSWITILKRRKTYRAAFDNFDAKKIAKYDEKKVQALLQDVGIIRNRLKVRAAIQNAKAFLAVKEEFESFDKFIWQFAPKKHSRPKTIKDIKPKTKESDEMSKELKKRGFTFVGSTICYAFMQATGMVNDHVDDCFLGNE